MRLFKKQKRSKVAFYLSDPEAADNFIVPGYTSLDKNPEILAAVKTIAELIGSITIHLMENTPQGDKRIVNELSRKLDIEPNQYMTRQTFIQAIVMNMMLYGKGNSVVRVHTNNGYIGDLEVIPSGKIAFDAVGNYGYRIRINGIPYEPDELLHFVYIPDKDYPWKGQGITASIKDIADNLKQARATEKGFLKSKWKPSLIIKVDASDETFSSKTGRDKLLEEYIEQNEAGKPWIIPAEQFQIEQIKPLSLADLAINDNMQLDKRTIAALIGVPPFLLGVGEYKKEAWNAFINSTVKSIVTTLQQQFTRKLIINPKWYYKFNVMSLYDWDLKTISEVFCSLSDRGYVDGNEVRDKFGLSPREGLDELRVLENYIPYEMSGKQKKLKQEDE